MNVVLLAAVKQPCGSERQNLPCNINNVIGCFRFCFEFR